MTAAEVQSVLEILCARLPGAALNAVREDYPDLAKVVDAAFEALESTVQAQADTLAKLREELALEKDARVYFFKKCLDAHILLDAKDSEYFPVPEELL